MVDHTSNNILINIRNITSSIPRGRKNNNKYGDQSVGKDKMVRFLPAARVLVAQLVEQIILLSRTA